MLAAMQALAEVPADAFRGRRDQNYFQSQKRF